MKNEHSGAASTILPVTVAITRSGSPPVPGFQYSGEGVASDGKIDLSGQPDYVLILFTLQTREGDRFASDPIAVAKIGGQPVCPSQGSPLPASVFKNPALDSTRTMLAVSDHNTGGANARDYQYALFFTASDGTGFSSDPKIINK